MHLNIYRFIVFVALSVLAACGGGNGVPAPPIGAPNVPTAVAKGSRLLEIQTNEPANGDFALAFNIAQRIGMDSASLSLNWDDTDIGTDNTTVPPTPIYQDDPGSDFLAIANGCYRNSNTKLSLLLRPVVTLVKRTPPGFETVAFDDPSMIARFNAYVDHLFTKISDIEITALAIGSEVDLFLTNDGRRNEYLTFYQQVSDHARTAYAQLYPGKPLLKIAVEVTHIGLLDSNSSAYYQQLNSFSDVIGVSYYPVEGGLVQDPSVVDGHFQEMIDLYPNKNLHFFQLGYPSGYYDASIYPEFQAGTVAPSINSSDALQSDFIQAVFGAWDTNATRIDLIGFTWMHDLTEAGVAATAADPAFGGTINPAPDFVEFLRTLGLRTDGATDKPAWVTLSDEVATRGWADTGFQLTCN